MTELSFLIELLLNHKLPKVTKDVVAERIKAVEAMDPRATRATASPVGVEPAPVVGHTLAAQQALSQRELAIAGKGGAAMFKPHR